MKEGGASAAHTVCVYLTAIRWRFGASFFETDRAGPPAFHYWSLPRSGVEADPPRRATGVTYGFSGVAVGGPRSASPERRHRPQERPMRFRAHGGPWARDNRPQKTSTDATEGALWRISFFAKPTNERFTEHGDAK